MGKVKRQFASNKANFNFPKGKAVSHKSSRRVYFADSVIENKSFNAGIVNTKEISKPILTVNSSRNRKFKKIQKDPGKVNSYRNTHVPHTSKYNVKNRQVHILKPLLKRKLLVKTPPPAPHVTTDMWMNKYETGSVISLNDDDKVPFTSFSTWDGNSLFDDK